MNALSGNSLPIMMTHLSSECRQHNDEPVSEEIDCSRRQIHHPIVDGDVNGRQYYRDRYFGRHDSKEVGAESIQSGRSLTHEDSLVIAHYGRNQSITVL